MGFAFATAHCIGCKRLFSFNPVRVPSTSVITGTREPICQTCITTINQHRRENNLPEWPVHSDAYEACEESEL
jgi:hypothetical protein